MLTSCTTTYEIGRVQDRRTRAELDAVVARGGYVHLRRPAGTRGPEVGYRVTGVTPSGWLIEPARGQTLLVAPEEIESVSTYHHGRGAGEGAIGVGLVGLLVGLSVGFLVAEATRSAPDPAQTALLSGTLLGVVCALVGVGIGGVEGHEDRYIITP
jgi:hypothetical protein